MSRLLNVSDLTSLVASHAQQLGRTKRKSLKNFGLYYPSKCLHQSFYSFRPP